MKRIFNNLGSSPMMVRFIFWFSALLLFFLAIVQFEDPAFAFRIVSWIVFPLVIPVHIHEYLFERFFMKKRSWVYFPLAGINLAVFGYLAKLLQKYVEPEGNAETYMSILFFMFLYLGIKYLVRGVKQQFRIKELEKKQTQTELDMLKSQVKPHFLFNSLNSIYSLILKNSDQSGPAVLILSDLMRYILESSKKKMVPLKEELDFIRNYIDLEKLRLGENFSLDFEIKGEYSNLFIAPMILIPFVENLFKHGVSAQGDNDFKLNIELKKNELYFFSENTIVENKHNLEEKAEKTGISNVKKRLELIYPANYHLDIQEKEAKFLVELELKLKV